MGKVQDTISRIGRRRRHQSSPEIALIIPSQQKPSSHSFPTGVRAVSSWISAQTGSGFETGVAGLIKGLQHSNRLKNSPLERLKIMDLFAVEIQRTMPHLNTRYLDMDHPYSLSAQTAFEQATTLLTELSFGYKIALVDVLLGRGKLNQKSRVVAIYQSMRAIAECGLRHSQSYTSWPDRSWRDINTLMLLAEHENALDFPVVEANTDNNKTKNPNTIHRLYTTLATFAVSRTEQFKPHEMDGLYSALSNNANTTRLLTEKPHNRETALYSVALNSANPPAPNRFSQYAKHHNIRYFSIVPIYTQSVNNASIDQEATASLTRSQFNKLNHIWAQSSPRQNARAIRHAPFYTQQGLKDIVATINANADENTFDNPFTTTWTIINESVTGIGLNAVDNDNCSTCVGDLIAWQAGGKQHKDNTYKVGIVRWLRCDTVEGLNIGVETIGQSVRTASIGRVVNQPSRYDSPIDALLCKEAIASNETALLLLPVNRFRLGETVKISIGKSGSDSQLKLIEKIDHNGNFDCFATIEVTVTAGSVQSHSMCS